MMKFLKISMMILILVLCSLTALAQTTAFSYQGRLSELGNPVTGTRYFRFTLFDENGAAIPGAVIDQTLTVTNGVFNTSLDFVAVVGALAFPGANRSMLISVKINAGDAYTNLSPRQDILAAPYSIKSKTADTATTADQLGGVDSSLFVQKDAGGNVSIAGGLTVAGTLSLDTVNATTQYNLGGQRVLSAAGNGNLFAGIFAGQSNTTGYDNAFFGNGAGQANTIGFENSFFGKSAGLRNTTGFRNSFFGLNAGINNTTGADNVFIGAAAGTDNQTGSENTFVGVFAGQKNTAGRNSFFGAGSGQENTTGMNNSFFGFVAGISNQIGRQNSFFGSNAGAFNNADFNSFFGAAAGQSNTTGTNNTFVGTSAGLFNQTGSQNSFFGRDAGRNNLAGFNSFFGFSAGSANTNGSNNAYFGNSAGLSNITGNNNAYFGTGAGDTATGSGNTAIGDNAGVTFFVGTTNTNGNNNTFLGYLAKPSIGNLTNATAIGANSLVSQSNSLILGNNANVGIGTSSPNSKLTVVGLIETTVGGVKFPDGTIQTSAFTGTSNSFIQNTTTQQAASNFNISGNGIVGGNLTFGGTLNGSGANLTNLNANSITTGTLSNARLGIIPFANGGTGLNAVGASGNFLRSNGAAWTSSPILAADIPTNLTGYIQNTNTPQSGANFNVAGNGTVGGTLTANKVQATSDSFVLGNFGIGTAAPRAKLDVTGGNILVDSPGNGIILKSPDANTCRLLTIDNAGAIALTVVICP